jgi:hypothetical protein
MTIHDSGADGNHTPRQPWETDLPTDPDIGTVSRDVGVMDFTPTTQAKRWRFYDDVFELAPELPIAVALRYQSKVAHMAEGKLTGDEQLELMTEVIEWGLVKKDRTRFRRLFSDEAEHPLGLTTFNRLLPWMFEQFGLRPTEPSPESADGSPSPDGGMNSTVSWPVTVLTSSPFDSSNS